MSTPTTSTATQPGSASKKPTDHVTTPSRLGLASPAPRSIPSPAATRKDQSGKTPTNHPTVSSMGSKTLGGTPMVQSLSQTGLTTSSSPGTHNAGFTPSGLGLGVDFGSGTPGQLNMPTPLAGSVGMTQTLSELGLAPSGGSKRNEDEDRRMKMRKVLKSIGRRKGRASRDGLDRIARRIGFDTSTEPGEVAIAGKKTLVTVHYREASLQDVTAKVFVDDNFKELEEYQAPIGGVLLRDLAVPDGILLHSNLDRFAVNLDRLARMDRLSAEVSCFAAMYGIYKSLDKLHELERKALEELRSISNTQARHEAMRKRSGRPTIHERNRVGLALDYWSTEESTWEPEHDRSAMDVDGADKMDGDTEATPEIFSLRIEAEGAPAAMYPSLRVSEAWLPDTFELPGPGSIEGIPWNDPPPTYVPHTSQTGDMAMDDSQRLPNLRFVAKLDPPIVMPYQTAMNILSVVGTQPAQLFGVSSYHAMLLGIASDATHQGTHQADGTVLVSQDDQELEVPHHYTLDVSKAEYGYKLAEFPFSHPRQVVELLPMLRQWAHAGALIQNVMKTNPSIDKATNNGIKNQPTTNGHTADDTDLNGLLESSSTTPAPLNVDIELSTSPQPTLAISYTDPKTSQVSNVTVQVMTNAEIMITNYERVNEAEGNFTNGSVDGGTETAKRLAKAFTISGDLGTFIEWQRRSSRNS